MAYVLNTPDRFRDDFRRGMVLAHPDLLQEVIGGIVTATVPESPQVAVVIGGGSGHYPAFAGLVGTGLADGAAMGDVFASPSARAVEAVSLAVDCGRGVLLAFGNYAGDVMNFERAAGLLRDRGIEVEVVAVTDDVASAPADRAELRRGIAGDLVVFKIAGAAAERGDHLAEVARLAHRANAATRTMGVAFGGTTLPGAGAPLFRVPEGHMALGMGIHGEPGIETLRLPTADQLAALLWARLKDEIDGDQNLVVLVNGLGAVKGEELYLLYRAVHELLAAEGHTVAEAQVGEFATSFEMPGLSITVASLDDELYELWRAPAQSAAYSRGAAARRTRAREARVVAQTAATASGSPDDGSAVRVVNAFERIVTAIEENEQTLGALDAIAGDGDHGIGMRRGSHGALDAARAAISGGAAATVIAAGDGWEDKAGGSSGAIWGAIWRAVGEHGFDLASLDATTVDELMKTMLAALRSFGAEPGDRTMLDAAIGLVDGWDQSDLSATLPVRWHAALQASTDAAVATAAMVPKLGRARTHADRHLDTPDPGAVSFALVASALTT